ncbi:putative acyltransferase (DUF342 family) [Rheinheimera pacifica]|uniref:DUF6701 domain-containing protein n=1 Tax=Rheinheimera pacifica TaxID=173990 RepID=UPI0021679A96|nr:DUF6701 domain-containing protein [Rheinheimera pacifica]MCS4308892.1 putative acyltransferase (DUF342 family) [Rheinheimera pacifica]
MRPIYRFAILCLMLLPVGAYAATYTMAANSRPPCSTSWSVSGTTYTCSGNGRVTLNNNDIISASAGSITLVAQNGFQLGTNVTLGQNSNRVNLQATYGSVVVAANSTIWGNIQTTSGAVGLTSSTVNGNVQTDATYNHNGGAVNGNINATNGVVLTNVTVSGTVTANSDVSITGSSIAGRVTSSSNKVTVANSTLQNGVSGSSGIQISGGTLNGGLESVCNNILLTNITMLAGDIKTSPQLGSGCSADRVEIVGGNITANIVGGANNVIIRDGAEFTGNIQARFNVLLDGSTLYGNISGESGYALQEAKLVNSVVYGSVTVGTSWQRIVGEGNSAIYGECTYGAINPATLCSQQVAQCLADNFNSPLSTESWITARSSGDFTPSVVNGRLRMTQNVGNQSTSVTYQRLYPAANNLVVVEFDYLAYGGNGADGLALVLSDATVTPQPGAFGGPLGYGFKPGIPGFSGGWLGFGLDEYGNYSAEGGSTNIGRRQQSVVVRGSGSGTTGYRYLRGTCNNGTSNTNGNCLSPAVDGNQNNPHRYRFTIDSRATGSTMVSVDRNTGNGFVNLIAPFNVQGQTGQAPVPENFFVSITGSTGGSNNIHELDNLSICAQRSMPVGQQIDHIELTHQATGIACVASAVQVKACLNADCSSLFTSPVSVDLSNSAGNWQTDPITLTNGVGTAYLRHPAGGVATIGVTETVPPRKAFSQTVCKVGSSSSNCQINFANAGLLFAQADGITPLSHQTAGVAFNGVLRAIRTNTTTGACEARAEGTKTVRLGFSCENPSSCIAGQQFSINNTSIAANSAASSTNRSNVNLTFNSSGSAPITMRYTDVGQLALHASLALPEQSPDPAITLNGSSTAFVVRPHTLAVVQALRQNGSANPGTTNTGDGFVAAGESFDAVIESRNADGAATPNFGKELTRQRVETVFDKLVYPLNGINGSLNNGLVDTSIVATAGRQTVRGIRWNEVGSINLRARLLNDSYIGTTDVSDKPVSGTIGRFYPASISAISTYTPACGGFSYMGQPFSIDVSLKALNLAGNITQNYFGDFASADLEVVTETSFTKVEDRFMFINVAGDPKIYPLTWDAGSSVVAAKGRFVRLANEPDGPFMKLDELADNRIKLGAKIANELDSVLIFAPNLIFDTNAKQLENTVAGSTSSNADFRYGRMVLDNAYGPENESLPLVLRAEYWNGARFITNPNDNCSVLSASAVVRPGSSDPNLQLRDESANTVLMSINSQASASILQQGRSMSLNGVPTLLLPAPQPQQRGRGDMEYRTDPWLQYDWDANGEFNNNPTAEFMFGRFRGNPRQIFWRELFP